MDTEEIYKKWKNGSSYLELSKEYNIAKSTVGRILEQKGVSSEEKLARQAHCGEKSGRWKGGKMTDLNGYIKITIQPGHLCYDKRDANNRIYEHRSVMAEHLGRPLYDHETVHHINGIRNDNRIENLELWSTIQPKGKRPQDLVKYAHEVLELYG